MAKSVGASSIAFHGQETKVMPGRSVCPVGRCGLLPGSAAPSGVPGLAGTVHSTRTPPSARGGEVVFSLKMTQENVIWSCLPSPLSSLIRYHTAPKRGVQLSSVKNVSVL